MSEKRHRHEKVRFRRRDIASLHTMPSAAGQTIHPVAARERTNWFIRSLKISAVIAAISFVLGVAGFFVLKAGLEGDKLTSRARVALQEAVGERFHANLESARITLGTEWLLAVEARDVTLTHTADGKPFASIASVRLGLAPLSLFAGQTGVSSISAEGLALTLPDTSRTNDASRAGFRDSQGLADSERIRSAVFDVSRRLVEMFENQSIRRVSIRDATIASRDAWQGRVINVGAMKVSRARSGRIELSGSVDIGGKEAELTGSLQQSARRRLALQLAINDIPVPLPQIKVNRRTGELLLAKAGLVSFSLSGTADDRGSGGILKAEVSVWQAPDNGEQTRLFTGHFELLPEQSKLEIAQARFTLGRTLLDFEGAIEPVAGSADGSDPHYRFNLVSNSARFAPDDSPEPALMAGIRILGTVDRELRRVDAGDLALRTSGGEVIGQLSAYRSSNAAPALFLALRVPKMPVGQAKQLWPAFAASGARNWVLDNVFGGMLRDSRLEMSVGPGRFGSGVALSDEEITGHFVVENTRFDVIGEIPPIRDAYGVVDFRGTNVDIQLQSGTAFLPSNRTVAANNGTLKIRAANVPPVIGDIVIDVQGDADAVAELASYEPIYALRHVDIAPADLSGIVEGTIRAEIPMGRERPDRTLDWAADLSYTGLAISKPFNGQIVDEAAGTIRLRPGSAVIEANAHLNGIPSRVKFVEPFGDGESEATREQDVTMILDDAVRARIAEGLNTILQGPVSLKLAGGDDAGRKMIADLTDATLTLPWIGWSKGAGIPAEAKFTLSQDGKNFALSDFGISGETFGAKGDIAISDGALARLELADVKLNRSDDFSVALKRSKSGYDITVQGAALDLRPMIKRYRDFVSGKEDLDAVPVRVGAELAVVRGFNDQEFSDFRMDLGTDGKALSILSMDFVRAPEIGSAIEYKAENGSRSFAFKSPDLGTVLSFLGTYERMEAGRIEAVLASNSGGPMIGEIDVRDFWLVDEPKLKSLTATSVPRGDGRSLNDALPQRIDTSRVKFDRGYAFVEKGSDYLKVDQGIVRGPVIGSTFAGMIYDGEGQMALNGTFIPAYGLNSAFSQIPLLGFVLGNGRDRGLIGLTYRLTGDPKAPNVQVNPLSVVAPGIFRSIFEFR